MYFNYHYKVKKNSPESATLWLFLVHVSSLALSFGICLNFYQSFKAYSLSLLLFKHLLQSMKNASTFVSITSNDYKSLKCITLYLNYPFNYLSHWSYLLHKIKIKHIRCVQSNTIHIKFTYPKTNHVTDLIFYFRIFLIQFY